MKISKIKVVILCAGKGTKLASITDKIPKVLIEIDGKSLLEYKLEILENLVDEIILVIGYLGDKIIEKFGNKYKSLNLKYCIQKNQLGTGHTLLQAKKYLNGKFLVMNGDDIYSKKDIKKLLSYKYGLLAKKIDNYSNFGIIKADSKGYLENIIEKPQTFISNMINAGCYVLDSSIFNINISVSERGEVEIIDYLKNLIKMKHLVKVEIASGYWFAVNNFEQLEIVKKYFEKTKKKCVAL